MNGSGKMCFLSRLSVDLQVWKMKLIVVNLALCRVLSPFDVVKTGKRMFNLFFF